ncbi:nicotinamide-nucleotide amidohydrolase family protein [Streptomyces sp. TRM43335]|uniref:Nicotinamide-nucleotide amidohydrolase family protein n=1 Tax=Streptomyces taklimakanensis TaxID=2569853 RepID=A0A6G2BGH3_9ACTN|nr:CinA family protein [Streptomyces taklimakanensis]MTE21304.1 nicotinamide-nucleotide amidohydrolase family protein [Streptomyces taklimakanensis]
MSDETVVAEREAGPDGDAEGETDGTRELTARALELLADRGQSVAAAESLTGGLVAAELTAAPGASTTVRGSVTAYATEVKRDVLGVDGGLLAERGAVDAEVARRMALGVRRVIGADWGLATTGVAGPEPQDGRPVGLVYVAVAGPGEPGGRAGDGEGRALALELHLDGDRAEIRDGTVRAVVRLLLNELVENAPAKDTEHGGGNGCLQP